MIVCRLRALQSRLQRRLFDTLDLGNNERVPGVKVADLFGDFKRPFALARHKQTQPHNDGPGDRRVHQAGGFNQRGVCICGSMGLSDQNELQNRLFEVGLALFPVVDAFDPLEGE